MLRIYLRTRALSSKLLNLRQMSSNKLPPGIYEKLVNEKTQSFVPSVDKSLSLARNLAQAQVPVESFALLVQEKAGVKSNLKTVSDEAIESFCQTLKESREKECNLANGLSYFMTFCQINDILDKRAKYDQAPLPLM